MAANTASAEPTADSGSSCYLDPAADQRAHPIFSPSSPLRPRPLSFDISTPDSIKAQLSRHRSRQVTSDPSRSCSLPEYAEQDTIQEGCPVGENPAKRIKLSPADLPARHTVDTIQMSNTMSGQSIPTRPNKGGRPRKYLVKTKPLMQFRKNRPLRSTLPADLWTQVFIHCPPNFLMQARMVNSTFYGILSQESIWRESRLATYGPDHPDPPSNVSEMQYADLLTGVGCQSRRCTNHQARTVYWAFQQRWCQKCFVSNTLEVGSSTSPIHDILR